MADKSVQNEVLQAYSSAFKKTPVLIRYPAGKNDPTYVRNDNQPFGYHDDAFSWETINKGKIRKVGFFHPECNVPMRWTNGRTIQ